MLNPMKYHTGNSGRAPLWLVLVCLFVIVTLANLVFTFGVIAMLTWPEVAAVVFATVMLTGGLLFTGVTMRRGVASRAAHSRGE